MRTVTTVTNLYTIEELGCANRTTALEAVARMREEDFNEFHSYDLVKSMTEAAEHFSMAITDYSIGLFDRSHVTVDTYHYMDLDNAEKNELVAWLNDNIEEGAKGSCPFTGVHYDCFFFDYFKKNGPTSYNTIHRDVPKAIVYMMEHVIDLEENSILDDKENEEYAKALDYEFRSDGTYYGQYI
jgi:hypothetical protein